ncbi:MAG: NnrS family protein [Stenotrophobium sp.]
MTTFPQIHPFRPSFLGAAGFASLGMLIWGAFLHMGWLPVTALSPLLWHGHEVLFGFAGALIGGFLLTAAANWTGMRTTTNR